MSTKQNQVSSLWSLLRMWEDPSRGVPTFLVLEFTSLRYVTNLAFIEPSFVCFERKTLVST